MHRKVLVRHAGDTGTNSGAIAEFYFAGVTGTHQAAGGNENPRRTGHLIE
jgi:hypothetical protein